MKKNIFILLVLLFFLNLADAFATYYWVTAGIAEELNPVALALLDIHPYVFLFVKCLFGSLSLVILWHLSKQYKKIISIVTFSWFFVYILVFIYHIKFIIEYFKNL